MIISVIGGLSYISFSVLKFRRDIQWLSRGVCSGLSFVVMGTISTKMEVHQSLLSEQRRFMLAVNEAKLVSKTDIGTENIIAIREASIAALKSTSDATSSQRHLVVSSLRIGLQEVRLWAKIYSRFLTEIESLYKSTNARIVGLRLSSTVRRKAQSDLEQIIVDAIARAGEINSSL